MFTMRVVDAKQVNDSGTEFVTLAEQVKGNVQPGACFGHEEEWKRQPESLF